MTPQRNIANQKGFSLIEVLISVLVMSVGLLGLGGLQMVSLKGSNNAHFRTVASLAATELADRMRSNPIAIAAAQYSASMNLKSCESAPAKQCVAGVSCSPEESASYDLYRVNCGVTQDGFQTGGIQYDLPEAFLSVGCGAVACGTGLEHTILVRWNETDDGDSDDAVQVRSYELNFIP